jgi:hypothetical protein
MYFLKDGLGIITHSVIASPGLSSNENKMNTLYFTHQSPEETAYRENYRDLRIIQSSTTSKRGGTSHFWHRQPVAGR